MADTFLPPRAPSVQIAGQTTYRVIRSDFGDGYSQRTKDGLNSIAQEWALAWENISADDADAIVAFFDDKGGAESFWWTPPRQIDQTRWICTQHTRTFINIEIDTVTARFERVYDL